MNHVASPVAPSERIATMNISGAYLNAPMKGAPVHMKVSADVSRAITELDPLYQAYVRPDGTVIVKLMKALYGCVQSAKRW